MSTFAVADIGIVGSKGVGSIDEECQRNNFDFGIVKFEWEGGNYTPEDPPIPPYIVSVVGDDHQANWTASPAVDGVLSKEGNSTYVNLGGTSGTITQTGQNAISHLTFCGDNETSTTTTIPETTTTVPSPEFTSVVIPALVVLFSLTIAYVYRKKH
ncbi:hypothetical protein ACFLRC_01280 [Candidatus Altiarchaeota archaeon]